MLRVQTRFGRSLKCWFLLAIFAVIFVTSVFSVAQSPSAAAGTIREIAAALRAKQYAAALRLIDPALRDSPNDARLRSMQGMALSALHQTSEALAAYQRVLKISPNYLPALEGAAQIEYEAGDKSAVSLLERILKENPEDMTSHAMLGALHYKQGDCRGAVLNFERSRKAIENQPTALQQYGSCLAQTDRVDDAIAVFQELVESTPGNNQTRTRLAALQLSAKRPKDAIVTLQPLLAERSEARNGVPDVRVAELASAAYEADGNTKEAVGLLNRALAAYPRDIDLYVDLAAMAFDHHSFASGIDVMTAGLRVLPDAVALYLERGVLYVQIGDFEKAEADFEKAQELDPQQTLSQVAQSKIAEQKGNVDEALKSVQRSLAETPNDAFLLYTRAEMLVQKGAEPGSADFQLALESARKAVTLQPRILAARNILCSLYLSAGQFGAAAEQARQILKEDPGNESALYHLIVSLRREGNTEELPDLLKRMAQLRQAANKGTWLRSQEDQSADTHQ